MNNATLEILGNMLDDTMEGLCEYRDNGMENLCLLYEGIYTGLTRAIEVVTRTDKRPTREKPQELNVINIPKKGQPR